MLMCLGSAISVFYRRIQPLRPSHHYPPTRNQKVGKRSIYTHGTYIVQRQTEDVDIVVRSTTLSSRDPSSSFRTLSCGSCRMNGTEGTECSKQVQLDGFLFTWCPIRPPHSQIQSVFLTYEGDTCLCEGDTCHFTWKFIPKICREKRPLGIIVNLKNWKLSDVSRLLMTRTDLVTSQSLEDDYSPYTRLPIFTAS